MNVLRIVKIEPTLHGGCRYTDQLLGRRHLFVPLTEPAVVTSQVELIQLPLSGAVSFQELSG